MTKIIETKWYACEKCRRVESYDVYDDNTTSFPRGEYLGHWDYLVTGLKSQAEAEAWLKKHPAPAESEGSADDR